MTAQPSPSPVQQPQLITPLRELIRDELARSGDPDPIATVDVVMATLSDDQFEAAAYYGVARLVSEEVRSHRRQAMHQPDTKSKRWAKTAATARDRPDLFAARIVIDHDEHGVDVYIFLGEATKRDLKAAAILLRKRGDDQQHAAYSQAGRYDALAGHLKSRAKVRSLPLTLVEQVLDA